MQTQASNPAATVLPAVGALAAYLTIGAKLESAAPRAREVIRVGRIGGMPWLSAADRAAHIWREAHREGRAALAGHGLEPRQLTLLVLAVGELVHQHADAAPSCDAEDRWHDALRSLEEAGSAIEAAGDAERDAPPASWADVREAAERAPF
jgi:hypothetical protein